MKRQIKGVTLRRPWSYAIAYLGKDIENRSWNCPLAIGNYLAIHSGSKWDEDAMQFLIRKYPRIVAKSSEQYTPGQIIAVAEFKGNITHSESEWWIGPIGWQLKEIVPIAPVACRGSPGLWDLSSDVLNQVRQGYKEVVSAWSA